MLINSAGDLGVRMRDQRLRLRLSQAELARRIGVSRYWIMELERGNTGAEIGLVFKALAALKLDVDVRTAGGAPGRSSVADEGDEWTPDLAAILERARRHVP